MAEVKVQEGESIESALRRFKRKVQQEDIIKDIKKHSFYLKPGDKRRAKQALGAKAQPQEDAAGARVGCRLESARGRRRGGVLTFDETYGHSRAVDRRYRVR